MRNAAIATLVSLTLALAAVGAAGAATPPKRTALATATGKISALKLKVITVKKRTGTGKLTCRVAKSSPRLTGFALGATARITCTKGVLSTIRKLPAAAAVPAKAITPGTGVVDDGTIDASPDKGNVGATTLKPAGSVVGTAAITALSATSITFAGALTCTINATSPSTAVFKVGSSVDYQCASGVLTRLGTSIE